MIAVGPWRIAIPPPLTWDIELPIPGRLQTGLPNHSWFGASPLALGTGGRNRWARNRRFRINRSPALRAPLSGLFSFEEAGTRPFRYSSPFSAPICRPHVTLGSSIRTCRGRQTAPHEYAQGNRGTVGVLGSGGDAVGGRQYIDPLAGWRSTGMRRVAPVRAVKERYPRMSGPAAGINCATARRWRAGGYHCG